MQWIRSGPVNSTSEPRIESSAVSNFFKGLPTSNVRTNALTHPPLAPTAALGPPAGARFGPPLGDREGAQRCEHASRRSEAKPNGVVHVRRAHKQRYNFTSNTSTLGAPQAHTVCARSMPTSNVGTIPRMTRRSKRCWA